MCGYPCADSMSARAHRRSLKMPDIRLQPIPALTYLRHLSSFVGGVHIRAVRRLPKHTCVHGPTPPIATPATNPALRDTQNPGKTTAVDRARMPLIRMGVEMSVIA